MKSIITLAVASFLTLPVMANKSGFYDPSASHHAERLPHHSRNVHSGGFTETLNTVSTVSQLNAMKDDEPVLLQGAIIKHVRGDHYLFQDSTGEVTVEIDEEYWNGETVSPQDKVALWGEVDKDLNRLKVEVKRLKKL